MPEQTCDLLGPLSWFVQGTLMCLSLSSLLVKRQLEHPPRPFKVWVFDTSKQGLAAGSEHFINLLLASLFGGVVDQGSPCVWYFLSGFMGFVFGTPFAYVVLRVVTSTARNVGFQPLCRTGVYNSQLTGPPLASWWAIQCGTWLCIIIVQRLCMAAMFSNPTIHHALAQFGGAVLAPVEGTVVLEIVVVIIVLPVMINCAEFWVQDNFLMEQDHDTREKRHSLSMSSTDFNKVLAANRKYTELKEDVSATGGEEDKPVEVP